MKKINIDEIIESKEFNRIIESDNLSEVFFKLLQDFVTKYSEEYNEQRELACRLYVYYLKYKNNLNHINNVYEKALLSFVGFFSLSEDTFNFLLSQDIDLDYQGEDMHGTPAVLKDSLALGISNPKLMAKFLDILKAEDVKTFSNPNYDLFTDTVHMNIVAGRIAESIKLFESSNYILFTEDNIDIEAPENTENIMQATSDNQDDKIMSLIKTTRGALISPELKRAFLNTILYSSKIRFFNKDSLGDLKEILNEDEYLRFINYLIEKVNSGEINLYSLQGVGNRIHLENANSIKDNPKYLKFKQ